MTTISLILDRRRPTKEGYFRICLLLYHNKHQVYIPTGFSIPSNEWMKSKEKIKSGSQTIEKPNDVNTHLLRKKSNAAEIIETLNRSNELDKLDIFELRDRILNKSEKISFYTFAQKVIDELHMAQSHGNARVYENAIACLKRFFPKKEDLSFEELNYKLLKTLEAKYRAKNDSINGLRIHLQTIRAIFNRAIKEKKVKRDLNPFIDYSIKSGESHKTAIQEQEIKLLEEIDLSLKPNLQLARNIFLFSFYCRGMDFMDIAKLKMKDIKDNRIYYSRSKTGRPFSIFVNGLIKNILDQYISDKKPDDYIFPIIGKRKALLIDEITYHRNLYNRRLRSLSKIAGISKPLHSKLARHTWANIAKQKDIPLAYIKEGLGHGNVRTTEIYLDNFDDSELDMVNFEITNTGPRKGDIDLKNVGNIL
jgi:integrase/recombinase XerD